MQKKPTTEKWKPVVGFEGLYKVSDQGRLCKFKFHLACDDDLHGLVSPEDIRAWQRKMTRKSYTLAWAKTHKKKSTPESRLAAKFKRCGVGRG